MGASIASRQSAPSRFSTRSVRISFSLLMSALHLKPHMNIKSRRWSERTGGQSGVSKGTASSELKVESRKSMPKTAYRKLFSALCRGDDLRICARKAHDFWRHSDCPSVDLPRESKAILRGSTALVSVGRSTRKIWEMRCAG